MISSLRRIPPENVRYHWCWGSWHGAHVNDIPLEHIIDIALKVKAQTYSFEAANVRHEHEPSNMQWQTRADAKAKDKWETKGCAR